MLITGHLFSKTMSPYLQSTFLAEEQQSRWTHALVCLYNSRQLQSYWLVLCWDHSNNQAVSHQTALVEPQWLQRNIWNAMCLFCCVSLVSSRDNNADILVSKGCLALSIITLQSQEVNQTYCCGALLCQKALRLCYQEKNACFHDKNKMNSFIQSHQSIHSTQLCIEKFGGGNNLNTLILSYGTIQKSSILEAEISYQDYNYKVLSRFGGLTGFYSPLHWLVFLSKMAFVDTIFPYL